MADELQVERAGAVTVLTLNRPRVLNAMDTPMWRALDAALDRVVDEAEVRAVVLAGAGRAFCAGADLKETDAMAAQIAAGKLGLPALREYKARLQGVTRKMQTCPKPFVAAVQGYAVGAGCELALSCDLVVAEEGARFGFPEVAVGLTITNGGTFLLPRMVGMAQAKELAFLGELADAETCRQMGLVNRVVPAGAARAAALEMAQAIARRAPLSVQFHKTAINRAAGADLEAALAMEAELAVLSLLSEDHREGARAFLEKREPKFVGR
jgi:enoyl-CoA hydratase/carnithine racemase